MREYTEKYKIQITSEHINEVNNQPEWRIEEYTKIFFKDGLVNSSYNTYEAWKNND